MTQNKVRSEAADTILDRMRVEKIMERDVQFCHQQAKGDVLASVMIEGFGGVPIVDNHQRLVGIVTEFDLLAVLDKGKNLSDVSADEIMSHEVISVSPHTNGRTLIYVLQTNHVIRVPVVDNDEKLIGIVARRDVIRGYISTNTQ